MDPNTTRRGNYESGSDYVLEYGSAAIELPVDVVDGKRVLLVDDVLATGGTLRAAAELTAQAGGTVAAFAVLLELSFLPGRAALGDTARPCAVTSSGSSSPHGIPSSARRASSRRRSDVAGTSLRRSPARSCIVRPEANSGRTTRS